MALTSIEAVTNPLTLSTTPLVEFAEVIPELQIGSLENPDDVNQAVEIIKNGDIVAAQFRNVFGLWFDAWNQEAANEALLIKETNDLTKPLATMMFSENFLPLIDMDLLSPEVAGLVEDPEAFQNRIGSLCHIGAPIRMDVVSEIPQRILSWRDGAPFMHNLDPYGHEPISIFIQSLNDAGIVYPGMTAVGIHNEAEFTKFEEVINLCEGSERVKILLEDPLVTHPEVLGSFPIIDLMNERIIREGHVPSDVVHQLFGMGLIQEDDGTMPAYYSHAKIFTDIDLKGLNPEQLRSAVITLIHLEQN